LRFSRSEPGLVVSAAAHTGLLLTLLIAFSDAEKFDDAQEAVPIDLVAESQVNQVMKGEKTAKEIKAAQRADKVAETEERKPLPPLAEANRDVAAPPPPARPKQPEPEDKPEAPPPPKRVAALPPAPEPPARPAQPAPQPPAKPQQSKAAPEPEDDEPDAEIVKPKPPVRPKPATQAKETSEKPKPPEKPLEKSKAKEEPRLKIDEVAKLLEQKKAAEKSNPAESKEDKKSDRPAAKPKSGDETAPKSKFDAASIASLLSHEAPQRRAATARDMTQTAALGAPTASAARMSPTMQAQIDAYTIEHYRKCWQASLTMNARTYAPRVEFRLTREGELEAPPRLLNPSSDPVERARGEQALRAVRRCSPMPIPPAFVPYYDYWRVTELDMREDM
jgi:hypothetical protein